MKEQWDADTLFMSGITLLNEKSKEDRLKEYVR
jgi:hypothetical protein